LTLVLAMSSSTDGSRIGTSSVLRERQSSKADDPSRPMTEMNWSMMPHGTPANSCSAFWHRSAFSTGSIFAGDGFDQGRRADFQRGAAGQTAAQRHGRMQQHVQPARIEAARRETGETPRG
jgi:hypothetical protein